MIEMQTIFAGLIISAALACAAFFGNLRQEPVFEGAAPAETAHYSITAGIRG